MNRLDELEGVNVQRAGQPNNRVVEPAVAALDAGNCRLLDTRPPREFGLREATGQPKGAQLGFPALRTALLGGHVGERMPLPHTGVKVWGVVVAFALLLLPSMAPAQRQVSRWAWTPVEVGMGATFATALWIDVAQTRYALTQGALEGNPLVGPRPSDGRLATYAALAGIATLGAAAVVPHGWRKAILAVGVCAELLAIRHNGAAGYAIRF